MSDLDADALFTRFRAVCMQALARREHSLAELLAKAPEGLSREKALLLLEDLKAHNLQSDARFCASYVRTKVEKGQGALKIQNALRTYGVDEALIEEALQDVDWQAQARLVYQKKYKSKAQDSKERAKRQRFMAQRGFAFQEILPLFRDED